AVAGGATDGAGRLLATFNVRYVVLERAPGVGRWLEQRDLGVARIERDYLLLENQSAFPRGAVYDRLPGAALDPGTASASEPATSAAELASFPARSTALVTVSRQAASAYAAGYARGPGAVFLGEARHPGWRARVGSAELDRIQESWGNAFTVPASAKGAVTIIYERPLGDLAWLFAALIAWLAVLGAAMSRRRSGLVTRRTVRASA
ncbi:MAG: hypothetical protein H0W09_02895, partial [Solirubrobacterales bacterium]|nr:hypothetical protein [Solirubrobacterales bacterium]